MKQSRNNRYDSIMRAAEIKRKQFIAQIEKQCCPSCISKSNECLNLQHMLKDGVESYRCNNYLRDQNVI